MHEAVGGLVELKLQSASDVMDAGRIAQFISGDEGVDGAAGAIGEWIGTEGGVDGLCAIFKGFQNVDGGEEVTGHLTRLLLA